MPSDETQMMLAEMAKDMPNMGFIWSLKDMNTKFNEIEQLGIKNLMLKKFLPQKELLQDSRVSIFMTHCGANGLFEAFYAGKALVGMPQAVDQISNCYKIRYMGIGQCLKKGIQKDGIIEAVNYIIAHENGVLKKADKIR